MKLFINELKKLFILFRTDPRAILAGIIAPTAILIIFAITFGNFKPFSVSIINQDQGNMGLILKQEILQQISPLENKAYFQDMKLDKETAVKKYQSGELLGVIIIPQDFSAKFQNSQNPRIEYYLNNYNTDLAKNMRLYLQEGILAFYQRYTPAKALEIEEIFTVQRQVHWFNIIATGVFLLAVLIGGMFSFLYLLFKEKSYGTLLEYQLAPVSPLASFNARLLFSLFMAVITGTFNGILIYLMTGMNLLTGLEYIIIPLLFTAIFYISFAAIFALYLNNFAGAAVGSMVIAVLLWFMSGGLVSTKGATGIIKIISYLIPNRYALEIIRDNLFSMQVYNLTFNYLILTLFAAVSLFAAVKVYKRKLWIYEKYR